MINFDVLILESLIKHSVIQFLMRITIAGTPGSGKSTVARKVAKKLGLMHYSVGDFMRAIAKKRKITLLELSRIAEKDKGKVDKELDNMQIKLRKKDDFVIDSRLGFHFIQSSIKVFLNCHENEAARRIFYHLRKEERENSSIKETLANIKRRKLSERIRYKEYYGIDINDMKKFDLVIDTTKADVNSVVSKIISFIKERNH